MSVVGLDVGNLTSVVALARRKGIDIVLNSQSGRETPSMINFGEKQRFIGCAAGEKMSMAPKNTVTQLKRIVGKKFAEPELQADLPLLNYTLTEGEAGEPVANVTYMGEQRTFSPERLLAMLLGDLKIIAENDQGSKVTDVVIGVPVFYTDTQRRAVLDAAHIAGFNCMRLMPETTAVALAYGIYKTDLPETEPLKVCFVDVGHSSMQVSVVAFKKGKLEILGTGYDRNFGGANFDDCLYQHLCKEFLEKYKIDVRSNARATLRLRVAVEKAKKVLSINPETGLSVECIMDDVDVRATLTRDLLEELAKEQLGRAMVPIQSALAEAGMKPEDCASIELVGGASRMPFLGKALMELFGKEPSRTLNATESVAKGCALQGAMLSPTFRVREFEVVDAYPYEVSFMWQAAPDDEAAASGGVCNSVVFQKNNPVPSTKLLTFFRSETFTVDACYNDPSQLPPGIKPQIASFTIGPVPPAKDGGKSKIKLKTRLNLHGVVSVESAQVVEEVVEEVPAAEAAPKAEEPKAEGEGEGEAKAGGEGQGDAKAEDGAAPMDAEAADAPKTKKKTVRTDIPVASTFAGMAGPALQEATEREFDMALQDRVMEETKEKKNLVEEYVYSMRNKLYAELEQYVTEEDRAAFSSVLDQTEDWLYEDGEDETKGVYVQKLEELKTRGDPIVERHAEEASRGPAVSALRATAGSYISMLSDPKYEHIEEEEKAKVKKECEDALAWLAEKEGLQAAAAKTDTPVLLTKDVTKKNDVIARFCQPIMSKPKPKPPPPPEPEKPAEGAKEEAAPMESEEGKPADGAAAEGGATPMAADDLD
mmetsp:Transcript_10607/g.36870  ORF Transcript_10607/g.36870 Transcript_10607/m.36870 type:complete len:821 (-) Transcript_10607:99-2561(-)